MGTIKQQIEALEFEREGYVTFDKPDRVEAVDEQLAYWRKQAKKRGDQADTEELSPTERKRAIADGVLTEKEAREIPASAGEDAANELAAQHASETKAGADSSVVTEAEVAREQEKPEEESNALAAQHASESEPANVEANVVTEAEVVAEVKTADDIARPALNASTEDWKTFAKHAGVEVSDDASRAEIVNAYIAKAAPAGNASKEDWVTYAKEHGIDPAGKDRDEIRAAAAAAGWATAPEPVEPPAPKRTTQDKTPRTTR